MALLAFICFDERCPHKVNIDNSANNVTAVSMADSNPNTGSNYPVAAVAILLWTGTLQVNCCPDC
jgi:hypothetical protein